MRQILEKLPQLQVIDEGDARRWVAGINTYHGARAEWHAARLFGIGGSEMGAVVSYYRGERSSGFSSITEVVEGKLMKRLPSFENFHMRRGNALEDLARQVYLKRVGGVVDSAAMAALACAPKRQGYEFMVGNPDDVVVVDGKRFVVDYKVPNAFSDTVDFDYEVQLHHYATLANIAGVRIDGLILAKLDLPPQIAEHLTRTYQDLDVARKGDLADSIVQMNTPGCRLVPIHVDLNRGLQAELLAAGKDCWNDFVLRGEIPVLGQRGKLELAGDVELELARYQQQYLMAKSGISHLDDLATKAKEGIVSLLSDVDYEGKELPLSVVNVKPNDLDSQKVINEAMSRGATKQELLSETRSYSIAALVQEVKRLGGDVEGDHLYDTSIDAAKAKQYLVDRGIDTKSLRKDGIAIALSRRKADAEVGEMYKAQASAWVSTWLEENLIDPGASDPEFAGAEIEREGYLPIEMETGHLSDAFASAHTLKVDEAVTTKHPMRALQGLR